jgi:hypothetical protein
LSDRPWKGPVRHSRTSGQSGDTRRHRGRIRY